MKFLLLRSFIKLLNLRTICTDLKTSFCVLFRRIFICFIWLNMALLSIAQLKIDMFLYVFLDTFCSTKNTSYSLLLIWCLEVNPGVILYLRFVVI